MSYYVSRQPRKTHPTVFSDVHLYEYKRTYENTAKHGNAVSRTHTLNLLVVCLFIRALYPTWAVAGPARHNICHVSVAPGLPLHSVQPVHIELTEFSCTEGMSTQECTNQSYFTSSTFWLNHSLPWFPFLLLQFLLSVLSQGLLST